MKSKLFFVLSFIIGIKPCLSQDHIGPKLVAMGNTGAAVQDVWSVNANPALITEIKTITAALSYQKPLVNTTLSSQAAGLIYPLIKSFFGLHCYRYGMEDFNEIKLSTMIAKKFGNLFSFAIRGNYHQIKITDHGTTNTLSVDVGMAFFPSPEVNVGFYLNNLTFAKYQTLSLSKRIPTKFHGGITYAFSDRIVIGTNINFEYLSLTQTLGLEYKISDALSVRGGLSSKPLEKYFGFGIALQKIVIDLAVTRTVFFTYTPQIGFSYEL